MQAMRLLGRRPRALLLLVPGAMAVGGVVSVSAFGAFTATISQSGTLSAGTIVLKENGSSNNCYSAGVSSGAILGSNSYACTTIDVFGAPTGQLPGGPSNTQTLTFTNVGSANASSFSATPSSCSTTSSGSFYGSDAAGFCGKVDVTIGNGAAVCYFPAQASACPALSASDTLGGLASAGTITIGSGLTAGASTTVVVSTELDGSASGSDMGLTATQGFTWTLSQ
jgi:hypothetical protein